MFSWPLEIVFVDFVFSMTWLYLYYVFNIHPTQSLLQRFNSCWGKPFDGEVGKGIKFLQLASYRGVPTGINGEEIKQSNISFDHIYDTAEESILLLFNRSFTSHRCSCHLLYRSPFPSASLLSGVHLLSHRARRASYLSNWTATCWLLDIGSAYAQNLPFHLI